MFKKCKVVMLPTNKKADIALNQNTNKLFLTKDYNAILTTYQHLSILSDEEIKEGDWHYDSSDNSIKQWSGNLKSNRLTSKKIIATTDSSLKIGDWIHNNALIPLPQPSQSFIEKYVEAYNADKPITDVMIEYEIIKECRKCGKVTNQDWENCHWIGNKAKTFPLECMEDLIEKELKLKVNPKDNTIIIKKVKDNFTKEELIKFVVQYSGMKKDSIERALDRWIEENL